MGKTLDNLIARKLIEKAYSVDVVNNEALVYWSDVRYVLGICYHIPKQFQLKVIDELIKDKVIERYNSKVIKINM